METGNKNLSVESAKWASPKWEFADGKFLFKIMLFDPGLGRRDFARGGAHQLKIELRGELIFKIRHKKEGVFSYRIPFQKVLFFVYKIDSKIFSKKVGVYNLQEKLNILKYPK